MAVVGTRKANTLASGAAKRVGVGVGSRVQQRALPCAATPAAHANVRLARGAPDAEAHELHAAGLKVHGRRGVDEPPDRGRVLRGEPRRVLRETGAQLASAARVVVVNVNVNVFSLGLSNATEEQQVYSAIWDMPMLQCVPVRTSTGCS